MQQSGRVLKVLSCDRPEPQESILIRITNDRPNINTLAVFHDEIRRVPIVA
jgi:hypothetical protein